jgi:FkbM family methyltransferase
MSSTEKVSGGVTSQLQAQAEARPCDGLLDGAQAATLLYTERVNGLPSAALARVANLRRRMHASQARRLQARLAGPKLIRAFGAAFPRAVFVEIGANDGEQHDHLRPMILEHNWRGVMVEPVPYVFERLQRNYAGIERVALENAAIAERDGCLPFYHLARVPDYESAGLPQWYDGIGSFSRDAVLDHVRLIPDIEHRLVETEVSCLTFESLCAKHGLSEIDLLLIDTEGYDYEILRHIDFSSYRPALAIYEHYHLDATERSASRAIMQAAGYETMQEGFDTWCLVPEADERLAATWRGLRPALPELAAENEPR